MKIEITNWIMAATAMLCLSSCARKITETGKASFYADKFQGRTTASGAVFKQEKLTAAHRTLPFGTKVTVINKANGRSVKVIVNDRGPFSGGRILDVSKKAARKLGMVNAGVASVEIKYKRRK
ncbi:MAG TPA: septal ring lytic transglycosylase RlpA family protein [Niastella sp.]